MYGNKYIVKVEDLTNGIIFYDYSNGYEVSYKLLQINIKTDNLWELQCLELSSGLNEVLQVNTLYPRDFYTDRLISCFKNI
jgi:hypothetical protein